MAYKVTFNKILTTPTGTPALYRPESASAGWYSDAACTILVNGAITPPSGNGTFEGYFTAPSGGTQYISSTGAFMNNFANVSISHDATLYAHWKDSPVSVVNYFSNLNGGFTFPSQLVPISSDSGEGRKHVAVSNGSLYSRDGTGNYPVHADSGRIWINPTVTYMVVGDLPDSSASIIQLGKGFALTTSTNYTGYMITSVEIVTRLKQFPIVTISAVANEGYFTHPVNSVNNFDVNQSKFNVNLHSLSLLARARAQNLLNAVNVNGGELQALTLRACCDPVVCEENLLPCASDIVRGRYELTAETLAPLGGGAPTAVSGSGFTFTGFPIEHNEGEYTRYTVRGIKEMI